MAWGMRAWSLYFLVKTGLYYAGYTGFDWIGNLLFAVSLAWPLRWPWARSARRWLAWPVALGLLYYDSFLPGPERLLGGLVAISGFSGEYLWELAGRVFDPLLVLGLLAGVAVYALLARRVPFAAFAFLGILSVPAAAQFGAEPSASAETSVISPAKSPSDPQGRLLAFYQDESRRKLQLPVGEKPAFDLVVLHVCSLAWDDLDVVNERNHPLFSRFDLMFSNFNTGASYSGPAALRMLYGACGQRQQGQLYGGAPRDCQIFPVLEQAGFRINGLLNHNGAFDDFSKVLEYRGGLRGKIQISRHAPVYLRSFDGSSIHDDHAALAGWWRQRQGQGNQPVALYYNTISLHDGNCLPGQGGCNSLGSYKPRLRKLLNDFDKFINQLESSGRPVVLVMMPEHGAALRAGKTQFSGMREIPGPHVTLVPAAIKLIGLKGQRQSGPLRVEQPTSYFDLNSLLADLVADSPYGANARPLSARLGSVGTTPFVAENEGVVVVRDAADGYLLKSGQGAWMPYAF